MRRVLLTILAWSLVGTNSARATDDLVAPELAVPLFLKILSYDQSYKFDKDKTVDFYLPYDKADAASYEQYRAARGYFQKNEDVTVFGAKVRFLPICCDSTKLVLSQVNPNHYNMMVLTSMSRAKVQELLDDQQGRSVRTYTLDPGQMSLGVAVGIKPTKGKNSIVVNLAEAEKEGTRFGAQLLRICELLEETP